VMLHKEEASEQSTSRGFIIIYDFVPKNIINPRFKGNINNLSMYYIYLVYNCGVVNGE
jgi:hypothetical protein